MKSGCKLSTSAGCCFIKYATSDEADRAIRALHNQQTLPGVSSLAAMHLQSSELAGLCLIV